MIYTHTHTYTQLQNRYLLRETLKNCYKTKFTAQIWANPCPCSPLSHFLQVFICTQTAEDNIFHLATKSSSHVHSRAGLCILHNTHGKNVTEENFISFAWTKKDFFLVLKERLLKLDVFRSHAFTLIHILCYFLNKNCIVMWTFTKIKLLLRYLINKFLEKIVYTSVSRAMGKCLKLLTMLCFDTPKLFPDKTRKTPEILPTGILINIT